VWFFVCFYVFVLVVTYNSRRISVPGGLNDDRVIEFVCAFFWRLWIFELLDESWSRVVFNG
jgi:hypothetical protein